MSDIALDPLTGDLLIVNGDLVLTTGSDATRQRVQQALSAYNGEWFLDLSYGIPYYQNILVKNPNPVVVEGLLRAAVQAVPGVLEILQFDLDYNAGARTLTLTIGIRTDDEPINFIQVLGG
jgi:hypothetical protein